MDLEPYLKPTLEVVDGKRRYRYKRWEGPVPAGYRIGSKGQLKKVSVGVIRERWSRKNLEGVDKGSKEWQLRMQYLTERMIENGDFEEILADKESPHYQFLVKLVVEHAHGRPVQRTEVSGDPNRPLEIVIRPELRVDG